MTFERPGRSQCTSRTRLSLDLGLFWLAWVLKKRVWSKNTNNPMFDQLSSIQRFYDTTFVMIFDRIRPLTGWSTGLGSYLFWTYRHPPASRVAFVMTLSTLPWDATMSAWGHNVAVLRMCRHNVCLLGWLMWPGQKRHGLENFRCQQLRNEHCSRERLTMESLLQRRVSRERPRPCSLRFHHAAAMFPEHISTN
jgi:hypothetical protein